MVLLPGQQLTQEHYIPSHTIMPCLFFAISFPRPLMAPAGLDVHAEHGLGGLVVTTCQKQEPRIGGITVSQYSGNSGRLTKELTFLSK